MLRRAESYILKLAAPLLRLITPYVTIPVIRSFGSKLTARLWNRDVVTAFPSQLQRSMLMKLAMIHAAIKLEDLRLPPGNRLEKLRGDREGVYSIRVNSQWRVCFRWTDGNAEDVEIVDYH